MLKVHAPFPQVGSYALLEEGGKTFLVRIQHRDPEGQGLALISFPGSYNASGNRKVAIADLIDGTPLTDAERREYAALEGALAGTSASTRSKKYKRYMALRLRDIAADSLAEALRRAGLASAAA